MRNRGGCKEWFTDSDAKSYPITNGFTRSMRAVTVADTYGFAKPNAYRYINTVCSTNT